MEDFEKIILPWPDWKIVKYLGGGAYGKVYEIERNVSGVQEKAALKIVSRPKDDNEIDDYYANGYDQESIIASYENEIRDYVQEYRLMKELQGQSNIVSCDDFTVVPHENGIGGDIFIRMELLTSLQQILKDRMLSVEEIIKLGKDISRALILCESKNIIHRDIKPVNIMVSQFGDFKLGDFGVSKIMDHETHATVMGTPEYEAPEIMHMEKYGQAVDIYSLGITLYWLLNNRRMPFIGADEQITPSRRSEAMEKRYAGKEKLPKPKNGSKRLKEIVLKACEYEPANRYASAQEMYDELDALKTGNTQTGKTPKKNKTVKPENRTETEKNGFEESGTIRGAVADDNWNESRETQGNSWRDETETIDKPRKIEKKPSTGQSGFQRSTVKNGFKVTVQDDFRSEEQEEFSTETVGVKNPKPKAERHRTRSGAYYTVKEDEITEEEKLLKEIKITYGGTRFFAILFLGFGIMLAGYFLFTPLMVVGAFMVFPIEIWDSKLSLKQWLKDARKIIPNLDQRIANDTEFAKRVYLAGPEDLIKYISKLNPEAGKELQNMAGKKK